MFQFNKDVDRSIAIVLLNSKKQDKKYEGGLRCFYGLSRKGFKTLLDERFVEPDEDCNGSPTQKWFFDNTDASCYFDGYLVSPDRPDYRVSIIRVFIPLRKFLEMPQEIRDRYLTADEVCAVNGDEDIFISFWWD